jgi:Fe2+ transport system protein FeoA
MSVLRTKDLKTAVCGQEANRRILKYDHSGRIFQSGLRFKVLRFKRPLGVRQLSVMSELKVGESGVLLALDLPDSVQNHLMHMGFVPGALVTALRRAPAGDPTVYSVDGTEIALRHETAGAIRVREPGTEDAISPPAPESPYLEAPELIEAVR